MAAIAKLLAVQGPAARYVVERDEPHDTYIYVSIIDGDGHQVLETIVEADGSQPDDDA